MFLIHKIQKIRDVVLGARLTISDANINLRLDTILKLR